jgi:DNA polymerase-3 subunit delta'
MSNFNWQIVGHKKIIHFLQKGIEKDRLSHAYIFYGAKHLGKKTVANYFAKSIFCQTRDSDDIIPCDTCVNCKQFKNKTHPDLITIKRISDKKTGKLKKNISIEQIKDASGKLSLSSFLKSYKIVIIEEAGALSLGAANSLLKILEEPKGKTIFILISQQLSSIPQTVVSRCQKIKFLPVSFSKNYDYLTAEKSIDRDKAISLTSIAQGRPGLFEYFLNASDGAENLQKHNDELKNILKLTEQEEYQRIEFINNLLPKKLETEEQKNTAFDFLNKWRALLRDMLLIKNRLPQTGTIHNFTNSDLADNLEAIARKYQNIQLINLLDKTKQSRIYLNSNVGCKLVLENFVLAL